ncbi:MAG TPA: outer membrane beta-barrel protein, partial [Nitrospira sp.]
MSVWKLMLGGCALVGCVSAVGASAWAEEASATATSQPAIHRVFPESWPISIRGWVDGGYTFNGSSPTSHFNGPYNAVDRDRPQMNQLYLIVEKTLRGTSGIDIGGRVDAMYGYDYFLTQSNGLERNQSGTPKWNHEQHGLALPQMYAEAGNQTFSVKAGHFYTIIGYEGVPAPAN